MKLSTTTALRSALSDAAAGVDMRLLEQLFAHMPDTAFFIKDAAGRYIAVNRSLLERHGLRDKSQMLGRRPCDICPGDFGRIPAQQDAHVLRTGRPIIERLELQWHSPHKPIWCLTTKLPMRDAAGTVTGLIGISKDVRSPVAPQDIPTGVAAALAQLEAGYADPLTPSELARIAKLPPARFARIIKRINAPASRLKNSRRGVKSEFLSFSAGNNSRVVRHGCRRSRTARSAVEVRVFRDELERPARHRALAVRSGRCHQGFGAAGVDGETGRSHCG